MDEGIGREDGGRLIPLDVGPASRVYVVRGRRCLLIDGGTPGSEGHIVAGLQGLGIGPADIGLILLSHGHYDHVGAAAALAAITGATLAVGWADAGLVQGTVAPVYRPGNALGHLSRWLGVSLAPRHVPPAAPGWFIAGEVSLSHLGIAGRIVPMPGHTAGSLSVWLESGELFVADLLMGLPGLRRPVRPIFINEPDLWRQSLRRALALRPRIIHVTHGGPFRPEAVARAFPWAAPAG